MAPKRKRAGTLSKQTEDAGSSNVSLIDDAAQLDAAMADSEPKDTNGHDVDTPAPASKRSRQSDADILKELEGGAGGERGKMTMEAPPTELVHPNGFRTNDPPEGRPVRVYADGVFDLFHLGHMRQLQQAKTIFPNTYLIVGVTGDKETHRRKGLTVLSGKERAESVRHCKWVDEVVEDCPWIISDHPEFMEEYKIDYIAHDDIPYGADEGDDIYLPIKQAGKFLVTQRTEGVSTTGIITKIVKDYEKYIDRQLKRGTPRQELNVSWLKKNELDIKRNMSELRDSIKQNWTNAGQEVGRELRQIWLQTAGHVANNRIMGSRPQSPAPGSMRRGYSSDNLTASGATLDIPRSPPNGLAEQSSEFQAGYSLGLIGGVRQWMQRSRKTLNERRDDESPDSGDESMLTSPAGRSPKLASKASSSSLRGRKSADGRKEKDQEQLDKQLAE